MNEDEYNGWNNNEKLMRSLPIIETINAGPSWFQANLHKYKKVKKSICNNVTKYWNKKMKNKTKKSEKKIDDVHYFGQKLILFFC